MIKQICSYCKAELGTLEDETHLVDRISHGICRNCLETLMAGSGEIFEEFLDSLQVPVFVVDANARVLTANSFARDMVSMDQEQITGRLGGEVFRCEYYDLPGGCGQTIHCKTCTIRNTVMETFETGKPCIRIPACQDLDTIAGPRKVNLFISTEKSCNMVLLRIDDIRTPAAVVPE